MEQSSGYALGYLFGVGCCSVLLLGIVAAAVFLVIRLILRRT